VPLLANFARSCRKTGGKLGENALLQYPLTAPSVRLLSRLPPAMQLVDCGGDPAPDRRAQGVGLIEKLVGPPVPGLTGALLWTS
jgi:hypothetical protein